MSPAKFGALPLGLTRLSLGYSDFCEALVAHSEALAGIPVRTHTLVGTPPAKAILTYAQAQQVDFMVLCSHGSTDVKRWALGSVAQKIARQSPIPVFILREEHPDTPGWEPDATHPLHTLVALDGSPLAEAVLPPATQLTAVLSPPALPGILHLLRVIKPPSDPEMRKYHLDDLNIHGYLQREAKRYMEAITDRVSREFATDPAVRVTSAVIEGSDAASTILSVAEAESETPAHPGYDLIALATHGRSGIQRWMIGSVAERVLGATHRPLLIVRPEEIMTERA